MVKRDGSIHVCGGFKVTLNQVAQCNMYPLPKPEDLLATLLGEKYFTKLDLSHVYQQLQLADDSKPFVTINANKGLYQYTCLSFESLAAPSIFQSTMENLFKGISCVVVYLDDILVTGENVEEHLEHLREVLSRIQKAGMRLK